MTSPGVQNLVIRMVVADANLAAAEIGKVNESFVATGAAATEGAARTNAALGTTNVALSETAARAAATGEANATAAAVASGAWTRTSEVVAGTGTAAVAAGRRFTEATELMKPLLGMVALFGAVSFFGGMIDEAKDGALGIRLVRQEFGAASEEVLKFGENAAHAFGMSASETDKMTVKFGQYLTSMRLGSRKDLADMSETLTEITANVARYNGVTTDEAATNIQMGLRGIGRGLKAYGITLDSAALSQAALDHHLKDASDPMAKYYALVDQTTKQMGAMDKAQGSLSLSQGQAKAAVHNLQDEMGQKLLPILGAAANIIGNSIVPMFTAMFSVVKPVLGIFTLLPQPVQIFVTAGLAMLALKGPLIAMLTGLSDRFYLMAASGAAAKIGMSGALEGASKFTGFLAGPWGLAIGAGIIALTSFFSSTSDNTKQTTDFSNAIDENTGLLLANASALSQDSIAKAGTGDIIEKLGISTKDYADALTGGSDKQEQFRQRIVKTFEAMSSDGAMKTMEATAKQNGLTVDQVAESYLKGTNSIRNNYDATNKAREAYQAFNSDADSLATTLKHEAQAHETNTDAMSDSLDMQDRDKLSALDLTRTLGNMADQTLPAVTEKVNTLRLGWSSMDDQVNTVIATLDRLAGRDAPLEQAIGNMYKALKAQADQFKLGQQGAVQLDPSKLYNPDGTINQRSTAGQNLYSTLTNDQQGIVAAGTAAYDQTYAKTHDLTQVRAAANKVVAEGYQLEEKNLTALLGSKKAADDLQKTYGHMPETVVTTIIMMTNQADAALTALGGKVAAVTGTENPLTGATSGSTPTGTITANAGGRVDTLASSTYSEQVPTGAAGVGAATATSGSTAGEQIPSAASGSKWSPSVERWRGAGLTALSVMGLPASDIDGVLRRINYESSGNDKAINLWDSNAKKGTPSEGLVQVIQPTFDAYSVAPYNKNIWDPVSNIVAGLSWSRAHYGPAGLINNGFFGSGPYDEGGWLMPNDVAVSRLSTPEPILSTAQWKIAEQSIQHTVNSSQGSGKSVVFQAGAFVFHGVPDATTQDAFREQMRRVATEEFERAK
ncbi:hypothetical protein SAMN04515671_1089 [Nakamurella panacisegetis]|uniref:Transglycosylase SLT domain-containing protein n=1 Tax=Nakamurella panacisegetis TaxID=1090615 RepID=A0A1H0JXW9_9ACTN|nr:hypothetical protein [Nakamurella panacisegetis]SDO48497.1 hypothetical protein SAMN04515671_1089 [Nakamurella panacisegetis]